MLLNKKSLIGAAVVAMFAGHAMAAPGTDTVLKNTGVTWQVNAVKDGKHSLLIEPQGAVNMIFDVTAKQWTTGHAPFKVSMLGQTGETVKLEAKLASGARLENTADNKSALNLKVSAGGTDLKVGTYQDIMGELNFGPDFGNTGVMQDALGKLTVSAVNGMAAGAPVSADQVADGSYTGEVIADFQATWAGAASQSVGV